MVVSVLIATYNGEKYIEEQLESIRSQTRQPDKVLIVDDRSTDKTVEIVKSFIEIHNLANWELEINETNKGCIKNFWDGLKTVGGDIIFLCDQDDIWDSRKIQIMVDEMVKNPQIKLLACGFEALYEEGNKQKVSGVIEKTMKGTGKLEKVQFDPSFSYVLRPGCVYALTSELWKLADEFWCDEVLHDAILWRAAALVDGLYILDLKLIYWRRFNTNSSNPYKRESEYQNRCLLMYHNILEGVIKRDVANFEYLLRFVDNNPNLFEYRKNQIVKKCYKYQKALEKSFVEKSIFQMIGIWFIYNKYFYSFRTYLKYLLLVIGAKLQEK